MPAHTMQFYTDRKIKQDFGQEDYIPPNTDQLDGTIKYYVIVNVRECSIFITIQDQPMGYKLQQSL